MLIRASAWHDNETCRRIVDAASEEFALHGYAGARIRNIVDAARVNIASINYYFGGKEGLYRATLGHLAAEALAGMPEEPGERRGPDPAKRLQRMVFALLERFVGTGRPSPLGRIFAHEAMDPSPHLDQLIEELTRPQLDRLRGLVREIAGPEVPDAEVTLAALGIMGQCLIYLFGRPALDRIYPWITSGPDVRRRLSRQITEFSIGGLAALRAGWSKPPADAARATAGAPKPLPVRRRSKVPGFKGH